MDVRTQIERALRRDPGRPALEFLGEPIPCSMLAALADCLLDRLDMGAVPQDAPVALVARNRPAHAATVLGLVAAGRTVSNVYAFQSPESLAADLARTRFAAIVADEQDWTTPLVDQALRNRTVGVALRWGERIPAAPVAGLERLGDGPFREPAAEAGIEILSSGTTGPPKRVLIPNRILVRAVESVSGGAADASAYPDIVAWPISGVGGTCCLIADVASERLIVLLEKFELEAWLSAIARHQPRSVNVPPAVLRILLDARVPRDAVGCLEYVFGGSAPLSPELQEEFESAYGTKVIWAYGATEFCGTLATWTPELHERYAHSKRGAMGRAFPGVELRVVDGETGEVLPRGEQGYLEARSPEISEDWIRTTDLAMIDEDEFVYHRGRGDGVIVRGGFKVMPERIDDVLREHPSVLDASTVGVADARLGHAPATALELRSGAPAPIREELDALIRSRLSAIHVPVRYRIAEALPRTTSMKPDLRAVRELLEESDGDPDR